MTRERWLLPLLQLLGFNEISVVHGSINVAGTDYPVKHLQRATVLHLMGARVNLDRRVAGVPGAARLSPHSLVQQLLNRSKDHLWAVVSNGLRLRILRDSVSLTRQAYVEFDLEAMFNGEIFADFVLLYRVAHATRFEADRPEDCLLERWITAAREDGIRALDQLRDGVEVTITTLGTGFLKHRDNATLRDAVDTGELSERDIYRHLLRLVYRLLFLFVAEDRDVLHTPDATPEQRDRYLRYYSTGRLRELAARTPTPGHGDLWQGLCALMEILGRDHGEPLLALPTLGSFLWAPDSIGVLSDANLDNTDLLTALQRLAYVEDDGTLRRIDFESLGAEELGSIYEALLELHPSIDDDRNFVLGGGAGSERKTTGSYYTPTVLIAELLDSALDPVLDAAATADNPVEAILALNVVDPAAGSGHFLVAAVHRIAKRLAEARTGEPEPPSDDYRTALRDVIANCIYAVDFNDLAVELCKVNLWLEAIEPGKPLSFLDHHIVCGNALLGATPEAIIDGLPNDAFTALTGDDKDVVRALKKRNRQERAGQTALDDGTADLTDLGDEIAKLDTLADDDLDTVRAKEQLLIDWQASNAHAHATLVADAWCAAFTIPKDRDTPVLTETAYRRLRDQQQIAPALESEIHRQADTHRYFHWHLSFPQIFTVAPDGTRTGGFDAVLGNPPWEVVQFSEIEFFAGLIPHIAETSGKDRKDLIEDLEASKPEVFAQYRRELRRIDAFRHFLKRSGCYPLCGNGQINTSSVFAELTCGVLSTSGRAGLVLPSGIATDNTTQYFFQHIVKRRQLESLYELENMGFFDAGHGHMLRFVLITLLGECIPSATTRVLFQGQSIAEIHDTERTFDLESDDLLLLNPNTRTCPIFRTRRDAEITKNIYEKFPVLLRDGAPSVNPWHVEFRHGLFHMTSDSSAFRTKRRLESEGFVQQGNLFVGSDELFVPLYEAKMFQQNDHRLGSFPDDGTRPHRLPSIEEASKSTPTKLAQPCYWVDHKLVTSQLRAVTNRWLLAWRNVTDSRASARTGIFSALPLVGVGNSAQLITAATNPHQLQLALNSFCGDYVLRQKVAGNNLTHTCLKQISVPTPNAISGFEAEVLGPEWFWHRFLELTYCAWDMVSVDPSGDPPFRWDPMRRANIRCEVDAAFMHIYGLDLEDTEYVLDTFTRIRRRDEAHHGDYRTKLRIVELHDRITEAKNNGKLFESDIVPPPGDVNQRHTCETRPDWADLYAAIGQG